MLCKWAVLKCCVLPLTAFPDVHKVLQRQLCCVCTLALLQPGCCTHLTSPCLSTAAEGGAGDVGVRARSAGNGAGVHQL